MKEHDGKHPSPDASPVTTDESNGSTICPVNGQAADAAKVEAATVVNAQAANPTNIETATIVNAPTPDSLGVSTNTSVLESAADAHATSIVASVLGSIPGLIDYKPFSAARIPAIDPFAGRQLPRSDLAEMAKSSDPIIGEANRLIWTPIGEPVRRYPSNFGQPDFSNGAEFGW